jgi:ABC-2 type transport system ATP-binding protein
MSGGPGRSHPDRVIEANELTKRYGRTTAVQDLTFTVRPGHVTGFLGPNGAGKSTTLRLMLGLNTPTAGTVTIDGRPFRDHRRGLRHVGALLDAGDVHGGRTAGAHLAALARGNASGSRPPCSATRRCCCSTNRSTGSTRKA